WSGATVRSIYFGGGTASLLPASALLEILAHLETLAPGAQNRECTIECEPKTKSTAELSRLVAGGFNRISVGVQSLNDELLKTLNRRHASHDSIEMLRAAQVIGFGNIHADLMFGLPGQSSAVWTETLGALLALEIATHISTYPLFIFAHEA